MSVVAVIGPDGAGKTTVARLLQERLPFRAKYLYMGGMQDHSSLRLPTTHLAIALRRWRDRLRNRPQEPSQPQDNRVARAVRGRLVALLNALFILATIADEWARQILISIYRMRGFLVILDRHFLFHHEVYIVGSAEKPLPIGTRVHSFILEHFYPRPHLVMYLDASPEVMFARKGEQGIERLHELRERYLSMRHRVSNFVVIDADLPLEEVVAAAVQIATTHYWKKTTPEESA